MALDPGQPIPIYFQLKTLLLEEILEGRYTLAVMFEYAGTLGLLDLNYVHPIGARNDFQANWGSDDLGALSRYDGLRAINPAKRR